MKFLYTFIIYLTTFICCYGADITYASVPFTSTPPAIDGNLSDPAWKKAVKVTLDKGVAGNAGKPVKFMTEVYILRSKDALYFGFKCRHPEAPELNTRQRVRDGNVFLDESIELFISGTSISDYFQFVINASGSKFDAHKHNGAWNGKWQSRTKISNGFWDAEIMMPFATINQSAGKKSFYYVNLCRNAVSNNYKEYSAWDYPGHHHPSVMLFCGKSNASAVINIKNLNKLLADLDENLPYFSEADRREVENLRIIVKNFSKRASGSVLIDPDEYVKILKEETKISNCIQALSAKAKINKILGPPSKRDADEIKLLDGNIFTAKKWLFASDPKYSFNFNCFKIVDTHNQKLFCKLDFSFQGFGSTRNSEKLKQFFSITDKKNKSLYELYYAKHNDNVFWVGRRIKACGNGLLIDIIISENHKSSDIGFSIQAYRSEMNDVFYINSKKCHYPLLPWIADKRKKEKFLVPKQSWFHSNPDSNKAYSIEVMNSGCFYVDTSINSNGRSSSILIYFYGKNPLSFFFSPADCKGVVLDKSANRDGGEPAWVQEAVRRSLEETAKRVKKWRVEIDGMMLKIKDISKTNDNNEELRRLYKQFEQISGNILMLCPKKVNFKDWEDLGFLMNKLKKNKFKLEEKLAFIIALEFHRN